MHAADRQLLSGDEAVALAALHAGVDLGIGYPGTPSTEILEYFSKLGGRAQWAPNEKVALEVGIGVAYAKGRVLVTMKHVGVNVAADPLFTVAYTGVSGGLVLVSADDPGMHSSQNEQDNRRYAEAAGVPMLEPSDSHEVYDYVHRAFEMSERWGVLVMIRLTTRICHSKTIVQPRTDLAEGGPRRLTPGFERDIRARVMIPAFARDAHRRMRRTLADIAAWNEQAELIAESDGDAALGIVTSGVPYAHVRDAAPEARVLKLGMTYPLPLRRIREFVSSVSRCVVIEEGDPYLVQALRAAGMNVEGKEEEYRFGELNVDRVRCILAAASDEEPPRPQSKPPELCSGCPHRSVFGVLARLNCIVAGDIGCYTLSVLPPFEAMDTCVCMGASIGVGLGLRHVLPPDEARRVVSVIGDSTFVHSGITGLVEMAYNPPPTGHVVLILDNGTTAMTGMQEHPGTGRRLDHSPTHKLDFEGLVRSIGIQRVHTIDPTESMGELQELVRKLLESGDLAVVIARHPCALAERNAKSKQAARVARCPDEQQP